VLVGCGDMLLVQGMLTDDFLETLTILEKRVLCAFRLQLAIGNYC
jgi:hypothetical protein